MFCKVCGEKTKFKTDYCDTHYWEKFNSPEKKTCSKCNTEWPRNNYRRDQSKSDGLYSSCIYCCRDHRKTKPFVPGNRQTSFCEICGNPFIPSKYQLRHGHGMFCSNACKNIGKSGKRSVKWKETTQHAQGYILIHTSDDTPMKREHIVIAEKMIGREITKEERVHHINCIKHDNEPDNLYVCSPSSHMKAHFSINDLIKPLIDAGIIYFDRELGIYRLAKSAEAEAI